MGDLSQTYGYGQGWLNSGFRGNRLVGTCTSGAGPGKANNLDFPEVFGLNLPVPSIYSSTELSILKSYS